MQISKGSISKTGNFVYVLSAIFVGLLIISPALNSGFFGDDVVNSLISGILTQSNQSLSDYISTKMSDFIRAGRFFPTAFYGYIVLSYVKSVFAYKLIIVLMTVVNIIFFAYFVFILTKSRALSIFSILIPPLLFQIRLYHDSLLGYNWLLQTVFLLTIGSLIFLFHYLTKSRRIYVALSIIFYLLSVMTYEIAYIFFVFHFLLIWFYSNDNNFRSNIIKAAPFIVVSMVAVFISLLIRFYYKIPISGSTLGPYVPNFNMGLFFGTLYKQTIAAFPLTYYMFDPHNIFSNINDYLNKNFLNSIIIFFGYTLLIFLTCKKLRKEVRRSQNKIKASYLAILGIAILIVPGTLISLSPKYQLEIGLGVGYLPVYISCFGLVMLLISIMYKLYEKINSERIAILFAIILAVSSGYTAMMNYNSNVVAVSVLNEKWLYPRAIIEDASHRGLFKGIPNGSLLFVDGDAQWDQSAFYLMHSGLKFKYVGRHGEYISSMFPNDSFRGNISDNGIFRFSEKEKIYYLRYVSKSSETGHAVLGKVHRLILNKNRIANAALYSIRIYFYSSKTTKFQLHTNILNRDDYAFARSTKMQSSRLNNISSGSNWSLYEFESTDNKIYSGESLRIEN